jgi:hypothetical protein
LPEGPLPELGSLSPQDKARWIFMERFIPLEQHETILGYTFAPEDFAAHEQDLGRLLEVMLMLPQVARAAEEGDLPVVQKAFASTLLLFRNPFIGDENGHPIPCALENLRQCYPSYFYKRRKKPNWYETQPFYAEPLGRAHWVLCELDYLNCTLRRPERKLIGYARQWNLPAEYARQKTVLEDIYDRIICGEGLGDHLFEQNCNSCTGTSYRHQGKGPLRIVYTVQKHGKIAIHGKAGIPHWKATRRLWPGVFPTLVIP